MNTEITFKINDAKPESLSQKRLVEYLAVLSTLYGEVDSVHFSAVEEGSICLKTNVEQSSYPAVVNNVVHSLNTKSRSKAATKIENLLYEDGYSKAEIISFDGKNLINFTGIEKPKPALTIDQSGSIQGILRSIEIGSSGKPKIKLQDAAGDTITCVTEESIAIKLGSSLLKKVRLDGSGRWENSDDTWKVVEFTASSFKVLNSKSWREVARSLENLPRIADLNEAHSRVLKDRH